MAVLDQGTERKRARGTERSLARGTER
jgi:hypothetical protein